ncbi:hypothetical protein [Psychroserpens sp. MEBiC05023]
MHKRLFLIYIVAMTSLSCGSGTFENDPDTWNKVFGEDPPKEIKIIDSRFWKSAHWSYEFELHVKFETSESFLNSYFIEHYKFEITKDPKLDLNFDDEKPEWFVPKSNENYDIYESSINNMVLFKEHNSNIIYLYALQV